MMVSWTDWEASAQGEKIMESVAALTSEDSLEREAQGGAIRYVSRHLLSPVAWSSPTRSPSPEVESIASALVLSPHNCAAPEQSGWSVGLERLLCLVS